VNSRAATVLALAAALLLVGCTSADQPDVTPTRTCHAAAQLRVGALFAVLDAPRTASDQLPSSNTISALDIDSRSSHLVATDGGTRYWLTRSTKGGVCIVATSIPDVTGDFAGCTETAVPPVNIVWSMSSDEGTDVELVADGQAGSPGLRRLSANVWSK
jgi:hypothetical protein